MNMNGRINRRKRQLGSIERDMLSELSLGDILCSFLLSARSTRRFYKLAHERAAYRHRCKRALDRLIELNYVEVTGDRLSITDHGQTALGEVILKTHDLLTTEPWDHKWRIAIFDIPEIYAPLRRKIRDILKRAGFVKLQQSVWIFPHECKDLIKLIKEESQLSRYVLYGVLDHIEGEERLQKLFHL
ncbi:MAG: hypothetical protein Q8Q13_01475 [bacterium]|nr:hypothetical protein [bacterium]